MKFHTYLQNLGSEGVKAELDGKALMDTGVALTVIDESLAEYIGIRPVGPIIGVELRGYAVRFKVN